MKLLEILTLASGILMIMLILVQTRGAEMGSGSGAELYSTRRGLDKSIFQFTIIVAFVFVASILGSILVK